MAPRQREDSLVTSVAHRTEEAVREHPKKTAGVVTLLLVALGAGGIPEVTKQGFSFAEHMTGHEAEIRALSNALDGLCGEGYAEWVLLDRPVAGETRRSWDRDGC